MGHVSVSSQSAGLCHGARHDTPRFAERRDTPGRRRAVLSCPGFAGSLLFFCAVGLFVLCASMGWCADRGVGASPSVQTPSRAAGSKQSEPLAGAPPIAISSVEELQKIGYEAGYPLDGSYVLLHDIDASATANWSDDGATTGTLEGFRPIGYPPGAAFTGVLDGGGHVIRGLVINRRAEQYTGLFGKIGPGAEVKNLDLISGSNEGFWYVGGLAGTNAGTVTACYSTQDVLGDDYVGGLLGENTGSVSDCYATGAVTASATPTGSIVDPTESTGGLVGENSGTVAGCFATGPVSGDVGVGGLIGESAQNPDDLCLRCYATGPVSGGACVGGLVGIVFGTVRECFAAGTVTASVIEYERGSSAGGLAGVNYGVLTQCFATGDVRGEVQAGGLVGGGADVGSTAVTQCYSTGRVTATMFAGGLIGVTDPDCTVVSSFWDTQTSGLTTSAGGAGETTPQMKRQATFVDWDFDNVWYIAENATYPLLKRIQQPPFAPHNVSPVDGAQRVAWAPVLAASAFADPNPQDNHGESQWQVRTTVSPGDWSETVFDSGATSMALTSCTLPCGALAPRTRYEWHVRYIDNHGASSSWSAPTLFQTKDPNRSAVLVLH